MGILMTMTKLSVSEPVSDLRHVPIRDNGEELVNFLEVCTDLLVDEPRFKYRRETMLRRTVAEMLCRANGLLPRGYRLLITEGWRPPHIQRRIYLWSWERFRKRHPEWSDVQLKRVVNRYTAPLSDKVPPPHTTGGAVDLYLAGEDGKALDLISPFERFDTRCYSLDSAGLSDIARKHRSILAEALSAAGMTNYPSEYWHWSYGDQGWAYRGRHSHALYGTIEPIGYEPAPEDVVDAPLEWIYRTDGQAERR
jgi:D-alanyl-D-alanine dipeptidase